MARVVKLSISNLKRLIAEEKAKLGAIKDVEKTKAKEVEADGFADTLEKDVDHAKALKVREAKLRRALKLVREQRVKLSRKSRSKRKK